MLIKDEQNDTRNTDDYNLSKTQLEMLTKPCPACGGRLYPVAEDNLWCNGCLISIDDSGGYVT